METLFRAKWLEMVPIVAGLALAMPAFALQIVCSPVTNGMGQPRTHMMTNSAGAVMFPLLFLTGIAYGPPGLVAAWWVGLGMMLEADGRPREAQAAYQEASRRGPLDAALADYARARAEALAAPTPR